MKWIEKNNAAALLLLALTACTQDIPDMPAEGDLISFAIPEVVTPYDGKPASRATLINSKLPLDSKFGVMGYCVARNIGDTSLDAPNSGSSNWEDKKELSRPDVLNQAPLRVDEYGCYYEDNTKLGRWYTDQSFPGVSAAGFKYTFIAYHPFEGRFAISTPNNNGIGAPTLTYTVVYGSADGQGDGASDNRIEREPELTTDAMYAQVKDHVRASGAVDLQFHHIMSGFSVQLNNYNETNVTVKRVTLDGGFYKTETVDFSTPDPTLTVGDAKYWGAFEFIRNGDVGVTIPGKSSLKAGATTEKPDGTIVLLLPNLFAAEGNYLGTDKNITVEYENVNGDSKKVRIENFNLGRIPQPGLNYRLNINFIGNQLLLMFTANEVEYWEEGSDNKIIIN